MILKTWLEDLNQQVKDNPKLLDLKIITSSDDEGNSFNEVYYTASFGTLDDDEFDANSGDLLDEHNAVCLN